MNLTAENEVLKSVGILTHASLAKRTVAILKVESDRQVKASLTKRVQDLLKAAEAEPKPEKTNPHDAPRAEAALRYQSAVNDFTAHAKAIVLAKSKKKREQLKALFLLLMLDASEDAYKTIYPKLAKLSPPKNKSVGIPTMEKGEAESYAIERQQYLDKFPEAVFDKLDATKQQAEHDGMNEKEIRAELNRAAEEIKEGRGKVLAETEAQCTYGAAEIKVLKRAGYTMKRWQTEEDERVRNSHENCQLQGAIDIDAKFGNGLHYPGEIGAPPEEICNCRCWLEGADK